MAAVESVSHKVGGGMSMSGAGSPVASVPHTGRSARVEGTLRSHGMSFPCIVDDSGAEGFAASVLVQSEDGATEWTMDVPQFAYSVLRDALGGYGTQTVNHWIFDHITIQVTRGDTRFFFAQRPLHKREVSESERKTDDAQLRDVLRTLTGPPTAGNAPTQSEAVTALRSAVAKGFNRVAFLSSEVQRVTAELASLSEVPQVLHTVSEATKGLEAALSSFKESQEDENAKLNNRLEETDQQRGKQIEQVQASVEVVREEVGEQLAAAQQELNEALTEQITAVKAAVGDLEGTTSELQSTMTAGFKRSDAAREELMASIQQQLQDLSAQLPLTESAQQKEMAEMARELQALKTQVAEDRRERTAEDVRQAELLKRQLEAVQAERAADRAAYEERISEVLQDIAAIKAKYDNVVVPQMQQQVQSERRSHVAEALSKLRQLEENRTTRPTHSASVAVGLGRSGSSRFRASPTRSYASFSSPRGQPLTASFLGATAVASPRHL